MTVVSDGTAEREEAIARADEHADPDWKEIAYRAIVWLARVYSEFTTDDVWDAMVRWYPQATTHEPRALGAIMRKAARNGVIEKTDRVRESIRPVCHRNPKAVWRSRVYGKQP